MTEKEKAAMSVTQSIDETAQNLQTVPGILKEQRRLMAIQRIGLALSVVTALTCAGYIVIFFQTQAWQVLGPAGLLAAASALFLTARNIARRGHPDRAAYLMVGVMLMLPSFALFWAGSTWVLAVGTLVLSIALAGLVLPRRQVVWAVPVSLLGAGLTFVIDQGVPWPRFDIAHLILFRAFVLGTIGIAVLAIFWQIVRAYQQATTIRIRLLIAFVLVALLPVVSMGVGAGLAGLRRDQKQALNRLETVVTLKEVEIKHWVRDSQIALVNVLNTEDPLEYMHWLLQEEARNPLRMQAHENFQDHFRRLISQDGRFEELFLMDSQGQVVVSTDATQEGRTFSDQAYFLQGLKGAYVLPPFYASPPGRMSVIFTRPVIDRQGHVFVLAGRANAATLEDIAHRQAGLGETGHIYLVGSDHALIATSSFTEEGNYVYSQAIKMAIDSQHSGSGLYDSYQGQAVLGAYRWLPDLQVALVIEQEQAEVFRGTYRALGGIVGIAAASVLVALAAWLLITRGIATPLANLAETATQIAAGNLELFAEVEREDEIGALAQALNAMTVQLRELISSLEQRVTNRTRDLEQRAVQLQAAAEVGRAATSIRDLDRLLSQVTHLINERFGYYHAGVFLLDEAGEYAVLRAANSEGGGRMLARGHRLQVGAQGIVGYVTGKGEPRIALDVGADAVYFDNPDMPNTRSEMALPLIAGGRVLGALDVQSTQEAAFSQEDIEVLQLLADQVAVAIESARLFAQTQEALEATRRAYGEVSRQAWAEALRTRPDLGFRSDERGVTSAKDVWRPEMERALHEGQIVQSNNGGQPLAVPIKVRGQVVGVLDTYKPDEAGQWTSEEIALLETLTEQLSLALEGARLYEDAQRHAARERLTREITGKIRASTDLKAILRMTVTEVSKALGTSHGAIRLGTEASMTTDGGQPQTAGEGGQE